MPIDSSSLRDADAINIGKHKYQCYSTCAQLDKYMPQDILHYPTLIDQAMRGMVRDILIRISSIGLPGEHHFYISLNTLHPGVKMSEGLRSKYPKEITIVLQHQFWDFKIEEHSFNVTLSFGGVPEKLTIPFAALTAFADPSVKFGLQFQTSDSVDSDTIASEIAQLPITAEPALREDTGSAEIISIEHFRKK